MTLCTLRAATVPSRDCRADFGRPLTKKEMSHSRDGPGVTASLRTNIVPLKSPRAQETNRNGKLELSEPFSRNRNWNWNCDRIGQPQSGKKTRNPEKRRKIGKNGNFDFLLFFSNFPTFSQSFSYFREFGVFLFCCWQNWHHPFLFSGTETGTQLLLFEVLKTQRKPFFQGAVQTET